MSLKTVFGLVILATVAFVAVSCGSVYAAANTPVDIFNQVCPDSPHGLTEQQAATYNSTACQEKNTGGRNPLFGPDGIMTRTISILSIVISVVSIISIMIAGFQYVISGNTPQEVSNARTRIIYALVALLVAVAAQGIVRFVLNQL